MTNLALNCDLGRRMKFRRTNTADALFLALILLLSAWAWFSALRIQGIIISGIGFLLEAVLVIQHNGKVRIRNIWFLWIADVLLMFAYATKYSESVLAFNLTLTLMVIFAVLLYSYAEEFTVNVLIRSILVFSFISCFFILIESVFPKTVIPIVSRLYSSEFVEDEIKAIRAGAGFSGLASTANIPSYSMLLLILYAFYAMPKQSSAGKGLIKKGILLLLALFVLFVVGERSNLVFMPLAILITYLFGDKPIRLNRWCKVFFGALCILGIVILLIPVLSQYRLFARILNTIEVFSSGGDISNGRSRLYEAALNDWKQSPIIGNGWYYFYHSHYGLLRADKLDHAHNLLLELLCDTGIVGCVLIMTPILYSLVDNFRTMRQSSGDRKRILKFTFAFQCFFLMDSMLHVTFYNRSIIVIYFLVVSCYYCAAAGIIPIASRKTAADG